MFPRFPDLPPEIRQIIWKLCLPRRVVQQCAPGYEEMLLDDYPQLCLARSTTRLNSNPPAVAAVCREAAQVAHDFGRKIPGAPDSWLDSMAWVQPRRDLVVHWNHPGFTGSDDPPSAEGLFLQCDDLQMPPSLMSEYLEVFLAKETAALGYNAPYTPSIRIPLAADKIWDCRNPICHIVEILKYQRFQNRTLFMPPFSLSLHIPLQTAFDSDLFGLLGDEPVQAVDIQDLPRLRRYADLFRAYCDLEEQRQLGDVFDHMLDTSFFLNRVEVWKEAVDWLLLAYLWYYEVKGPLQAGGTTVTMNSQKLYSVWLPAYRPGQTVFRMGEHRIDEAHPWTIEAKRITWRIQPQVMFRWCINNCYLLEENKTRRFAG